MIEPQSISLKIGDYKVISIPTGIFGLDGGAMFGTVPKVLWEKQIPADNQNRIPMEARALLLVGTKRRILIDCGNGTDFIQKYGEKMGSKFSQMYNIDPNGPSLLNSLSKVGVHPDDITDVIFTHLHFDHCGGGTIANDGELEPQFKNATYYVQKQNFEIAQKPNLRERASYLEANFMPLYKQKKLQLLDGNQIDFLPGVSVEVSHGHTQGQQWVRVSDGITTLAYCADVIATSAHVRKAWVMGYDLDPLTIIKEKTALLDRASNDNWFLFFEHDPFIDACKVIKAKDDFAVSETFKFI